MCCVLRLAFSRFSVLVDITSPYVSPTRTDRMIACLGDIVIELRLSYIDIRYSQCQGGPTSLEIKDQDQPEDRNMDIACSSLWQKTKRYDDLETWLLDADVFARAVALQSLYNFKSKHTIRKHASILRPDKHILRRHGNGSNLVKSKQYTSSYLSIALPDEASFISPSHGDSYRQEIVI